MSPDALKRALLQAGVAAADIASELGVARNTVTTAINGRTRTPYIRRAIAEAVNKPYSEVWGEVDPGVDRLRLTQRNRHNPSQDVTGSGGSDAAQAGAT